MHHEAYKGIVSSLLTDIHSDPIDFDNSTFDNVHHLPFLFNMSKILTVVGATGAQGGSVVTSALKSGAYKVRGVTRNVESARAKALAAQGVEMVAADTNDLASLVKAFKVSFSGSPTGTKSLIQTYTNRSRVLMPSLLSPISLPPSLPTALKKRLPLSLTRESTAQRPPPRLPPLSTISGVLSRTTKRSPAANTPCLTLRARLGSMSTFARIRRC